MTKRLKILALGGNEVSPSGTVDLITGKLIVPDISEQWRKTAETCELLANLIEENIDDLFILTHGNGPQVGNVLLRSEYAQPILHHLPLDVCDADTQGAMGYMLAQLTNALSIRGKNRTVAETITRVVIDKNDPGFLNPSKFIGPSYSKKDAEERQHQDGRVLKFYKKDENGEELWRWVVPSPIPVDIVEIDLIENNLFSGIIPIVVGGGGIPVIQVMPEIINNEEIYECNYNIMYKRKFEPEVPPAIIYSGVEAVIDKDLASGLLGTMLINRAKKRDESIEAELMIFTDVDGAKLNYQKPNQTDLRHLNLGEAIDLYEKNVFPAGSMGPKIKAAIDFIRGGGKKVYITKVDLTQKTFEGKAGTTINA